MQNKIKKVYDTYFSAIGPALKPEQGNVIANVLQGKNTLCIMPTGGGKSLCYWVAGKALEGITLVIFPLTALMDEQAEKLRGHNCIVSVFHSGINSRDQYEELMNIQSGQHPDFIFLSPERLATDGFLEYVLKGLSNHIKLVVVDEIHCISQWGHDFRPFYKEIPQFLINVFGSASPTILGLTATIGEKDAAQICSEFKISGKDILRSKYLLRYNIRTKVVKVADEDEKDRLLWKLLKSKKDEKVLIYIDRISGTRSTEYFSEIANRNGYKADCFHAERSSKEKADIIRRFKSGDVTTIFATSAFGMGIDIPDIRGVIHYLPVDSVEQYYQQVGRAGRDKKPAWAVLFYSEVNLDRRRSRFINSAFPKEEHILEAFNVLSDNEIGKKTVNYFQETTVQVAYQYLVTRGLVKVVAKGIQSLESFESVGPLAEFDSYIAATKNHKLITTARKLGLTEDEISENVFKWLAAREIKFTRIPDKCLVVESFRDNVSEDDMAAIIADVEEKRRYKNDKFDDFIRILRSFSDPSTFQESIGAYLGIGKFELTRRHQTLSGDVVRSKSEVIIANILTERGIFFDYEPSMRPIGGAAYSPDFAISHKGVVYYWEHLGMLDNDEYAANWAIKKSWYDKHFPGQLITTEESPILSNIAEDIVNQYFN